MKSFIPVALAPVVLTGCALNTHTPPAVPAQHFVTTLIQEQLPLIQLAQAELAKASRIQLSTKPVSSTSPPAKNATGTPALAGAGKSQTLRQALRQIVPAGWHITFSQELNPDTRESLQWAGNDQWPFVLDDVLQRNSKVALLDWQTKRVSVAAKSAAFTPGTAVALPQIKTPGSASTTPVIADKKNGVAPGRNPFAGKLPTPPSIAVVKTTAVVSLPKTVVKPKAWRIEAGSTLKDTLFNWAASETCATPGVANWTVAWLTQANYRIDAPLQFEGSFRDALNGLFTLYGTAKVPLYAGIRNEQCVISVDDKEIH
ncbi:MULTISPECIES: toxin co-regulated pilus biosynthesis Q family protein [Serratia]|uniref:toxin co-regulated pilus biosynthesis Q family protein n=1 Tax=Serratia TaxID=613 RepID=UPI001F4C4DA8|nr:MULTISPECIES: toxin co-regulated pilus biosynthesis Q family protein [Serratia]ULG12869.1 PilL [Serratia liquefaciens]ULG12977.1 PilL [Serratia liquefaciens]ULG18800.1 PilL [Serratia proteamaculans]CAI1213716.1 Toxin co-regulated pilus biosynthesis protein Q [Serratia quinivorans]CAI2536454.1 Toxin co-regulated pilus biosynthesis protein Q [Serratia liquefaciens]